jgi:ethanolamine ammonia-lyase large subunit
MRLDTLHMNSQALRQLFALANAFKEGDLVIGGTRDGRVREEARHALGAVTIGQLRRTALIEDDVTVALDRSRDRRFDGDLDPLPVTQLKNMLIGAGAAAWARRHRDALASEAVAAVVKIMTSEELSVVARTAWA